ncbi:MAG: SulP family inorganic anion transporter [Gammaproteobacteria bacterium]|nr:SulP family inorganic anion transporter [Gammaproteobacteria bacterium]
MRIDTLSGLTVALALVPEAIAFAFVAQVDPLVGLYAAFFVGLITAIFGGRPGMISGATGALAVVMTALVVEHGVQYLFATVVLMGILQLLAGIFRLGKLIRMVPHPVMLGFVNGLAIVIFLAQMSQFKETLPNGDTVWLSGMAMYGMLGLIGLTMALIWVTPKLTKAIPGPLLAIVVVSILAIVLDIDTRTVGDMASLSAGLPTFIIPDVPMNFETLTIIFPYALILAAVGLIESLLTLNLVNDMLDKRGGASRECLAQGAANVVSGFFGTMGGCAMIGQTMINVSSGGRGRTAGIAAALFLLSFILFASSLIEQIPIAALVGVMFMVVIGTFAWSSFNIIRQIPLKDAFVLILVSGVTVISDLAVAVIVGVIVSALVYSWEMAKHLNVSSHVDSDGKHYKINGHLFFGSASEFHYFFTPNEDPDVTEVDFFNARVWDHSGIEAIETLAEKYDRAGKTLVLRHLSADCRALLDKKGKMVLMEEYDDPVYGLAVDYQGQEAPAGH